MLNGIDEEFTLKFIFNDVLNFISLDLNKFINKKEIIEINYCFKKDLKDLFLLIQRQSKNENNSKFGLELVHI